MSTDVLDLLPLGLAPTADAPPGRPPGPERRPAYRPCACGTLVLYGQDDHGAVLALDVQARCYTVLWHDTPTPHLKMSRAYPVHRCVQHP